jgi:hypothetical protein
MIVWMSTEKAFPGRRWQIGAHALWEAAPDAVRLNLVGVVDGDELKKIVQTEYAWAHGKPKWFVVADLSRLGGSTPSSRAYMAEIPSNSASISITFGMGFTTRILVDMMMRARRHLKPNEPDNFAMVATEADAWAEVERRRQLRA